MQIYFLFYPVCSIFAMEKFYIFLVKFFSFSTVISGFVTYVERKKCFKTYDVIYNTSLGGINLL